MCDNCRHPKPKFNGKDYICQLIDCISDTGERLKAKEIVKILVGETNSLIKQHKSRKLGGVWEWKRKVKRILACRDSPMFG